MSLMMPLIQRNLKHANKFNPTQNPITITDEQPKTKESKPHHYIQLSRTKWDNK